MLSLGALTLANPLILLALAGLPLLWLLLRVTPPAPRTTPFPAIRLLYRLQSRDETPDRTPWWLLLLRLLIAALVIAALAKPILNAASTLPGSGPLVIVVDDDWAAGRDWAERIETANALVIRAGREQRAVILLTTAGSLPGEDERIAQRPAGDASDLLRSLRPSPWPARPDLLAERLRAAEVPVPAETFWVSNGIRDPGDGELIAALRRLGGLTMITGRSGGPRIPALAEAAGRTTAVEVTRLAPGPAEPVAIRAIAGDGRLLARATGAFGPGDRTARLEIILPVELRNQTGRIVVEGEAAGGVLLLDDGFRRRPVGLVSETAYRGSQPLLDELHYIEQALAPSSEVTRAPLDVLLDAGMSAVVLPDIGRLSSDDQTRLSAWVREGGVLIRFAGPQLADTDRDRSARDDDSLVPVRLRTGDRTLGGALSWSTPLAITRFPEGGPFARMASYGDVTVRRQVLAEPSIDLTDRTWARLQDGTPIVTGREHGDGWLVLFHTTATPDWSDLALSGLFVDMLRRVVGLGSGMAAPAAGRALAPIETLDGFGHLGSPPAGTRSWSPADDVVSPDLPPGYFGSADVRYALNLAIDPDELAPEAPPPPGVGTRELGAQSERDLQTPLLVVACMLFLADLLITLVLRGYLSGTRAATRAAAPVLLALVAGVPDGPAKAQLIERPGDSRALEATLETRLAYVITGIERVDQVSQAGLDALSRVLGERTSVVLPSALGVDPATDELAFFVLLYWPVPPDHPPLAPGAAERINTFMRNGGTVLFDTRDRFESDPDGIGSGMERLRVLGRDLDLPPLAPVPVGHVLTKSFYLLRDFPGRFAGGPVWAQDQRHTAATEVSPVIVGSHDWIGAWARDDTGLFVFPVIPGGELQREYAFRFGVNLVMYALTGNYKADQVHVPAILERLGQ